MVNKGEEKLRKRKRNERKKKYRDKEIIDLKKVMTERKDKIIKRTTISFFFL